MERSASIQDFEQYLRRRAPERRTAIDYTSDVRQFAAFCSKDWREVTMHDIDKFVDHQRQAHMSAATIKRRVAALKVFFDFLAEESGDLAWANPVRHKRHAGKQPSRLPRDLRDTDVAAIWATIRKPRDQAWFVLMWRGGLRVGEVVGLKLTDILAAPQAEQPARIRVCGKGQKERIVLLTADAYAVLTAWLQERPVSSASQVFLNERGGPISANGIEGLLRNYGRQAGCTVTPHQLRHTFARQVTEAGMPITSLSKLLGHAQVSTTQIYTAGADPALPRPIRLP
jgi:site-specific recombinase XerD